MGTDLGTSSVKAAVMIKNGAAKQVTSQTYPVQSPAPGVDRDRARGLVMACLVSGGQSTRLVGRCR